MPEALPEAPATVGAERFVRGNAELVAPGLVPEVRLYLATEVTPLWEATEAFLAREGVPPPFWAFAWPGGRALARYVLDHPDVVRGRRVLDFGSGSAVSGIAAALAGARSVLAADVDPFAAVAARLNAEANGVCVETTTDDLVGLDGDWDVVLAGDVCYERPMSDRVTPWLRGLAEAARTVIVGDPGRKYLPQGGLTEVASYAVPTSLDVEDSELMETVVWELRLQAA